MAFRNTMALSCIIFGIKRDIGRKSRFFQAFCIRPSTPPIRGIPVSILFGTDKQEWYFWGT